MTDDHSRRRATFDQVALLYDKARPGYPDALFDDVVALSGMPPGGQVLEVGCGTGQATVPFARRGYRILAIELGANLAAVARRNLAAYPEARVYVGSFEEYAIEAESFDLVTSATAFHWIEPAVRYAKAARALKPGGAIALFWYHHVWSAASGDFFDEIQEFYLRASEAKAREYQGLPQPDDLTTTVKEEIDATGLFSEVAIRTYRWDLEYDAASYIDVLNTYSDHRDLPDDKREQLFRDIADLIDTRYSGRIVKGYVTQLYVAKRLI
jgi:SAM-dependent methyltransferase